jgi:hypothetical protein
MKAWILLNAEREAWTSHQSVFKGEDYTDVPHFAGNTRSSR